MDYFKCRDFNCTIPAGFSCEKDHDHLKLCMGHYNEHISECSYKRDEAIIGQDSKVRLIAGFDESQPTKFVFFNDRLYLAAIYLEPIKIPNEYGTALEQLTNAFAADMMKMPGGSEEVVIDKALEFAIALQKIVFNLKIDYKKLAQKLSQIYTNFHTEKTNFRVDKLNQLLSSAKKELNLAEEVPGKWGLWGKKRLSNFETEFLSNYIGKDIIDSGVIEKDFFLSFKDFVTTNNDVSHLFREFERDIKRHHNKSYSDSLELVRKKAFKSWSFLETQKLCIYLHEISHEDPILLNNWTMIACLLLQSEQVILHSVQKLSDNDILISLAFTNFSFIFHYNQSKFRLVAILNSVKFIIASGSNPSSILIWQDYPRTCEFYSIKNSRLEKFAIVDIKLLPTETLTGLAYIEAQRRIIYTTNIEVLNSVIINNNRVKIALDLDQEKPLALVYDLKRSQVLIKSMSTLIILNDYLQIVKVLKREGSSIECCKGYNCLRLAIRYKDFLVDFSVQLNSEPAQEEETLHHDIIPCTHFISKDLHLVLHTDKIDPYYPYHSKKFIIV